MNISGIYKIQSKIKPNRIYIGSAINFSQRWQKHLNDLKLNKHGNGKLQNHYNKYGGSDLQFSVLLGCEKEDLIRHEQFFIDSYNPYFNICKIAGSGLGTKRSDATRKKMSESNKGENNAMFGKHPSIETRKKLSLARQGRKPMLGKHLSKESCEKKSKSMKGKNTKPKSKETKLKMSEAKKGTIGYWRGRKKESPSKETRLKMRNTALKNGNKPPLRHKKLLTVP